MTPKPVYIASAGIISALGNGLVETTASLADGRRPLSPLSLFALLQGNPMVVGQVAGQVVGQVDSPLEHSDLPRTHLLARQAAEQALADAPRRPDAVILGSTTGGILSTEELLRDRVSGPARYRYHSLQSVTDDIAALAGCTGEALTVSTACSSGAVALALALRLLRAGSHDCILVGGVDSLSRLTYFGFHSLQLVDAAGCRPLDRDRRGISVAEAAAMLVLTRERPAAPLACILGAGLSCDAYHPTAPHPEGEGALAAMAGALADAGLAPEQIDYLNLHGTGTPDNDLAESRAIRRLFPQPPPLSSIKGATGHSLAAAGAVEAVVAALALDRGFLPGNPGCRTPDPDLGLTPVTAFSRQKITKVLSNSLGFGGNNGALVLGRADAGAAVAETVFQDPTRPLAVHGRACLTGAGDLDATLARLATTAPAAGPVPGDQEIGTIPVKMLRRVKRLARLALILAETAQRDSAGRRPPETVFLGTGWGALSETWDFLKVLEESAERFPRPVDFVGSVHNGAAGQIALLFGATGANVTTSGGDASFAQALIAAEALLEQDQSALLVGVDEYHPEFSALLDPSVSAEGPAADGGGALSLSRDPAGARCLVRSLIYRGTTEKDRVAGPMCSLGEALSGMTGIAAIFVGVPAAERELGEAQLAALRLHLPAGVPLIRYRKLVGEFASAQAVAAVLAVSCCENDTLPASLTGSTALPLHGGRILVLGIGRTLSLMEFQRP